MWFTLGEVLAINDSSTFFKRPSFENFLTKFNTLSSKHPPSWEKVDLWNSSRRWFKLRIWIRFQESPIGCLQSAQQVNQLQQLKLQLFKVLENDHSKLKILTKLVEKMCDYWTMPKTRENSIEKVKSIWVFRTCKCRHSRVFRFQPKFKQKNHSKVFGENWANSADWLLPWTPVQARWNALSFSLWFMNGNS